MISAVIDSKDATEATITVTYNRALVEGEKAKTVTLDPTGNETVGEAQVAKKVYTYAVTELKNDTAKDIEVTVSVEGTDKNAKFTIPADEDKVVAEELEKVVDQELTEGTDLAKDHSKTIKTELEKLVDGKKVTVKVTKVTDNNADGKKYNVELTSKKDTDKKDSKEINVSVKNA